MLAQTALLMYCFFVILQAVKKTMTIKDATGKAMEAVEVFGACINFLSNHLFDRVKQSIPESKKEDIQYVLTVPAIWNEGAKLFMKEAAKKVNCHKLSPCYQHGEEVKCIPHFCGYTTGFFALCRMTP